MDKEKEYILYVLPLIVFVINRIPYIGKYLRVVNTLIHESGHAIAALITKGEVYTVELFSDTSGTAITQKKGKFSRFLISIIGYPFSSAVAYFLFYLIKSDKCQVVLYILACFALLNLMFYVRNAYGIFWLITFTAIIFLIKFCSGEYLQYAFTVWLSGIMLFESLYSSVELVIIAVKNKKSSGDAYNLQLITGIPSILWALFFTVQAGYIIYLTVCLYF